ncbi:hypothetical protein BDW67DRAFT_168108 [Aspergillus spinulosporus]
MSDRNPATGREPPGSLSADKRFFDEANATFQSDGGWCNTSVPDAAMATRTEQGSRYQGPDLEEDEGNLAAEADAAMGASPAFGSYLDEQVEVGASENQTINPNALELGRDDDQG